MAKEETIVFQKKIYVTGGSHALTVPLELINFLELKEGDEINLAAYTGKRGKYISLWKK